jgi:hypothetical protein
MSGVSEAGAQKTPAVTLQCRSRTLRQLTGLCITLGASVVLILVALETPSEGVIFPIVGLVIAVWLIDGFLTRASVFEFRTAGTVRIDEEGLVAAVRQPGEYSRSGSGYILRSALLRRRLGLFDSPNSFRWSSLTLLRIAPGKPGSTDYIGTLDFRGPPPVTRGLVELMGQLRIDIPSHQLPVVLAYVLGAQGHVHVSPGLIAQWGVPVRKCPDVPGYDPRLGGSCVREVPPELVTRQSPLSSDSSRLPPVDTSV